MNVREQFAPANDSDIVHRVLQATMHFSVPWLVGPIVLLAEVFGMRAVGVPEKVASAIKEDVSVVRWSACRY